MEEQVPRPIVWVLIVAAFGYVGAVFVGAASGPQPPPATVQAAPPVVPYDPGFAPVTLTFWNLEWFPGRKPKASENARAAHLAAVVPVLQKLNPDVLGLEEVADQAAAQSLADRLPGFKVDVCSQFPLPDSDEIGKQQEVLCSRLPVLQAWAEPWKKGADGVLPRRGFVVAAYQPAAGQVLIAYDVHLKSNRVDTPGGEGDNLAMRQESARQLLAHAQKMQAAYASLGRVAVVIGGDMNTSLDDPRFAAETTLRGWQGAGFQWIWTGVPMAQRYTLPGEGRYPATCFDHIFLLGPGLQLAEPAVEPTARACSDHRPVTARLVRGR